MLRLSLAFCLFALSACASSSERLAKAEAQREAARAAEATDQCLADPSLAETWGECNVKRTIFQRMAAIGACQRKFAKGGPQDTMVLKIRINRDGSVREVTADESVYPANAKLQACLAKEVRSLKFARPPKGVKPIVYYPVQP